MFFLNTYLNIVLFSKHVVLLGPKAQSWGFSAVLVFFLIFRVTLNMQASIACVQGPVTSHLNWGKYGDQFGDQS